MNDRELLELAAKAAGYLEDGYRAMFREGEGWVCMRPADEKCPFVGIWAPLTDDGDALRLAVKLRLDICRPFGEFEGVFVWLDHKGDFIEEPHGDDPCAATRRAIVRAAAAIGAAA